jgi:hypothetical protein
MNSPQTSAPAPRKPLRLWPGVLVVGIQWLVVAAAFLISGARPIALIVALGGGLVIILWWLLFSRAAWSERVGAIVLMVVAVLATRSVVHPSVSNAGMGNMMYVFSIPFLGQALVLGLVATRRLSTGARRAWMVVAIALSCSVFTLVRTGGITGDGGSDLHWRWTPTPEQRLLAQGEERIEPAPPPAPAPALSTPTPPAVPAPTTEKAPPPAAAAPADAAKTPDKLAPPPSEPPAIWPGFRGPNRDSVIRGVELVTDWSASPPVELWRRPIGPGWSSFAVRGNLVYTQEQRGNDEDVSCYNLTNGKLVWRHRDTARFWESNGGAGPRGTPAVSNGRVYTLGATGIVNALDANTGAVVWSRNAATDTGAPLPGWGFAGSPLVVEDVVIVAASGRLVGYDVASGKPRWFFKSGGGSYSSPQLMTIDGVTQIVMLSSIGATGVAPADGTRLWDHAWEGASMLQPASTSDGDLLITTGDMMGGLGVRRIGVAHKPGAWAVEERWTSRGLKPYFNDYVVHKGHVYGFDSSILACIDLKDGERRWKGGRYGHGQLLLLPDQDLLLVLSEEGELALVKATADQFNEIARFKAIEGKTWNHPALAGNILLVRNDQEMAAFKLSLAGR